MFKNFLIKQMLSKQLKGVPKEELDKILAIIEKNPDLFMKIAAEAQEKIKGGMPQQEAMKIVMEQHQEELKGIGDQLK